MGKTSNPTPREIGGAGGAGTYDDMLGAVSMARQPASNAPTWTSITRDGVTFDALAFDTGDKIPLFVQTSHGVQLNQLIENHIHWDITGNDAGDEFQFQITGVGAGIGEAFQSIGTVKSGDVVLAGDEMGKHNYLEIGELPAINTTVSTLFVIILERIAPDDGNDTTEDIIVYFNDSHPLLDTMGSLNEDSKS